MTAFRAVFFILLLSSQYGDAFRIARQQKKRGRHASESNKAMPMGGKLTKAEFSKINNSEDVAENTSDLESGRLRTSQHLDHHSLVGSSSSTVSSNAKLERSEGKPWPTCDNMKQIEENSCVTQCLLDEHPKCDCFYLPHPGSNEGILCSKTFWKRTVNGVKVQACDTSSRFHLGSEKRCKGLSMSITTWNVAAINTNPFEFWNTCDEQYTNIVKEFDGVLDGTSKYANVPVDSVFHGYIDQLSVLMKGTSFQKVKPLYDTKIKSQTLRAFLLQWSDATFAAARWISWPDRYTQTFKGRYRPSVITPCTEGFGKKGDELKGWWDSWKNFMFAGDQPAFSNMQKLDPSYRTPKPPGVPPAPEDYEDNIEKQVMYLAVFDAIFVFLMYEMNPSWVELKRKMVDSVVTGKMQKTLDVLVNHIHRKTPDIICLQESGSQLSDMLKQNKICDDHDQHQPTQSAYILYRAKDFVEGKAQNSILLLRKAKFKAVELVEHSPEQLKLKAGDLITVFATDHSGVPFLINSFHGLSDGSSTFTVIPDLVRYSNNVKNGHVLFGMDANTKAENIAPLLSLLGDSHMATAWGSQYSEAWITTNKARTAVQAQPDKGVPFNKLATKADRSPKDHILHPAAFKAQEISRENGKDGAWTDEMFPSADFPSDHAIVHAKLFAPSPLLRTNAGAGGQSASAPGSPTTKTEELR